MGSEMCIRDRRGLARAVPSHAHAARVVATAPPPVSGSFYRRPAKALERGGGFYVPGLEGDRLRIAAATLVSAAIVANHVTSSQPLAEQQQASEAIGAFLAAYTLVQAAVERATAAASGRAAEKRKATLAVVDAGTEALASLDLAASASTLGERAAAEFGWAGRATLDSIAADALFLVSTSGALLASWVSPSASSLPAQLNGKASALLLAAFAQPSGACDGASLARGAELLRAVGPATQAQAALLAPVQSQAALIALSPRAGAFSEEDARWLECVAARIGAACSSASV